MTDFTALLNALAASSGGGFGGGGGGNLLRQFRVSQADPQAFEPLRAPNTWNLGESLLNLLSLGSAPMAAQGQVIANSLERLGRITGGEMTLEDRSLVERIRGGDGLGATVDEVGRVVGEYTGIMGDTLGAVFAGGDSTKIPTWAKNLSRIQDASQQLGWIDESQKMNDVGLAIAGLGLDIALDPTTYLTLGVGGALKGAFQGAAKAGTTTGEAVVRAGKQAEELGQLPGTLLGRPVTKSDRLAGALEGAGSGFRSEFGQFWPKQMIDESRERKAARAAGVTPATEGLAPVGGGGAAARSLEAEAAAGARVADELTPEAAAAGRAGGELADGAEDAASLGARAASDVIDELGDDILGSVPKRAGATIREQASNAWGTTLARSVSTYARGTQQALRQITPFQAKTVVKPLSSVGVTGEKDIMGGVVSFWKQAKSGKPLSRPRADLKPQLDEVAKTRISLAELDAGYPALAELIRGAGLGARRRAQHSATRTTVDGSDVLDLLASDRLAAAVRTLERGGTPKAPATGSTLDVRIGELLGSQREGKLELLRAADAEARRLVAGLVDKVSAKAMKGTSGVPVAAQRAAWRANIVQLLARTARGVESDPAWVERTADELARITDPLKLGERLDEIASSVHLLKHRGPKEFFDYIEKIPGRQVLEQIDAQGIRDFARLIGVPTSGNALTVLKALRTSGYASYREAIAAERAATRAFGTTDVAGHDLIDEGVRALGNNVQPIKARLMRNADTAFRGLDPEDADAVFAALSPALQRNLAGKAKAAKATKAGELEIVTPVRLPDGTMSQPRHLIQRIEDYTQYQAWSGLVRHFSARADAEGLTGAARGRFMDEKVMSALAAQDAWLRARGMPPTSRMTDAEKTFRLGGKSGVQYRNEVAFLSLRDVLEEIPAETRIALLYTGRHAAIPPTILHMLGRWAIRRYEAPTAEIAERIVEHRNAFIQHAWKIIDSKSAGLFSSNRAKARDFGALADQILSDPDVVARLSDKHVRNAIVARGVWADSAASASMPIRNAFRKSMASPSLPVGAKIEDLLDFTGGIAKALNQAGIEDDLVHSMAQLDAAVIVGESVGPDLFYAARRADAARRASAISDTGKALTDDELLTLQRQWADQQIQDALAGVGRDGGLKRLKETLRTKAAREAEATSGVKLLADAEEDITGIVDGAVRELLDNGMDVGATDVMALRAHVQMQLGFSNRTAQNFLARFKRGYGTEDANILRTMAQFAPIQGTERFGAGLAQLVAKYPVPEGAVANPTIVAGFRLLQRMDGPVTLADGTVTTGQRVMADYVDALKAFNTGNGPREAVDATLSAFQQALRVSGAPEAADDVVEAAVDLWPAVAKVFDTSPYGLFARAGNDGDDLNRILSVFQRSDGAPEPKPLELYGGFMFTRNGTAGDLAAAWRGIGAAGQDIDPIEILRSTHAALQHATVAPTVAASFSREFGHIRFGLSREEAIRKGFKLPPEQSDARRPFLKYLDPTQLYDPEHISKLIYLDDLLQGVRKPGPLLAKLIERTDPIVQAMKSSITIWRPGHWVTNIMGEAWMNLFAGVTNPARYADSIRLMVRNHRMVKPDTSFFDDYLARNAPEGMVPRPLAAGESGLELRVGGKLQSYPDDLVYRGLEQRGIVLSHMQADDVIYDAELGAIRQGDKKPFQGIRNANRALGRASVARDSVFRVAHALDVLKRGSFRSLDEALDRAAAAVHKWHPSYQTLTPFDQVYTRRVIYFYTWLRQAVARVLELSLNQPSLAALPSRVQYAIAYANGLDPESVGSPVAADLTLPDYLANSVTGSALQVNDRIYGMSLNAPTLDIFNQIFSQWEVDPTRSLPDNFANSLGNWVGDNVGSMISPALSIPYTLATNQTMRGQDFDPDAAVASRIQNVIDMTGLGYISRITGQIAPGVPRTDIRDDPTDQGERQMLALINALTGLKVNAQSAGNVQTAGARDERERFARWLEMQAQ